MKLYYAPQACSMASHIILRELQLPFEAIRVDNRSKRTADGQDFLGINPKGYVAALQLDNGEVLTEGPAILQYLADLKPESGLAAPNGTWQRVRLQETLNFITTEIHGPWATCSTRPSMKRPKKCSARSWPSAWHCWSRHWNARTTCKAHNSGLPMPTCSRCCAGPPCSPSSWRTGRPWCDSRPR